MKKLFFPLILAGAICFVSCGNSSVKLSAEEIEAISLDGYNALDPLVVSLTDDGLTESKAQKALDVAYLALHLSNLSKETVSLDPEKTALVNVPFSAEVLVDHFTTENNEYLEVIYWLDCEGIAEAVVTPANQSEALWDVVREDVLSRLVNDADRPKITKEAEYIIKAMYFRTKRYSQLAFHGVNFQKDDKVERIVAVFLRDDSNNQQ